MGCIQDILLRVIEAGTSLFWWESCPFVMQIQILSQPTTNVDIGRNVLQPKSMTW